MVQSLTDETSGHLSGLNKTPIVQAQGDRVWNFDEMAKVISPQTDLKFPYSLPEAKFINWFDGWL